MLSFIQSNPPPQFTYRDILAVSPGEAGEMCVAIRLTPTGQLRWEAPADGTESAAFASLQKAFHADWRGGLFTLAAEKANLDEAPTVRYWQALAERYLTGLCHIPATTETFEVEAPS